MAVREALWDCQYCDKTGINGRFKRCPNCTRSRPEGTKFYLPQDAAAVTDEALLTEAAKGPDWICAFCDSSNPADATACVNCLASRADSDAKQEVKEFGLGAVPTSGDIAAAAEPARPAPTQTVTRRRNPRLALAVTGAVLVALLCICSAALLLLRGSETTATVMGTSWQRTVEIEALTLVTESGWAVPGGARLIGEEERIQSYDQVLSHYETRSREVAEQVQVGERTFVCGQRDLGNGFFEDIECTEPVYETQYRTETYEEPVYEEVPVYATFYTYELFAWVPMRTETLSGSDHEARWPTLNLAENEREGERAGRYVVIFETAEGERLEWAASEAEWLGFQIGDSAQLTLNSRGEITDAQPAG